jgi:membrane-associated phospholipid phosphatase
MLTTLQNWDRWLFTKINQDWTNSFLDTIFPLWREAITWVPLYIFLLAFVFINFGKKAWPWVAGLLVTVLLTDQISSHILKPYVNRMRPCHDIYLADHIRLLLRYCSDSRSFTSSHATNHFGVAFFIFFTMKPYFKKWGYLFFAWAATISYGQVYIGVHYPLDVICGALLGSTIGYYIAVFFNKKIGISSFDHAANPIATV